MRIGRPLSFLIAPAFNFDVYVTDDTTLSISLLSTP